MTFTGKIICILAIFMVTSFALNLIGPLAFALGITGLIFATFMAGAFIISGRQSDLDQQSLNKLTDAERDRLAPLAEIQFGTAATKHHTARGGSRFPFHKRGHYE